MEKILKEITERNFNLGIFGTYIIAFTIGSMFSIKLVLFGYFILIISAIVIATYIRHICMTWYNNKKVKLSTAETGYLGGLLLLVFFGIQSPQVLFKPYILMTEFFEFPDKCPYDEEKKWGIWFHEK